MTVYDEFIAEVEALTIRGDDSAVHVVGLLTRAVKRAQNKIDARDRAAAVGTPARASGGEMPRIDIAEFRELGFVQEINRLILHPCGLALSVDIGDDGAETLGGVFDDRGDPEGWYFDLADGLATKASSVAALTNDRAAARTAALGYIVQPIEGTSS
jgi:hypothetical protein